MELSPIANKSVADKKLDSAVDRGNTQNNPDIFSTTSPFRLQEPAANNKASAADIHANTSKASAKSAANVFAAKRIESNNQNTILALIAGVSLCVLLAVAAYFYLFLDRAPDFSPSLSTVKPVATLPENTVQTIASQAEPNAQITPDQPVVEATLERQSAPQAIEPTITQANEVAMQAEKPLKNTPKSAAFREESLTENEVVLNQMLVEKTPGNRLAQVNRNEPRTIGFENIASKSASIQVSKTKPQMGVNPILMDAFNAYNAGNDDVASKLYRQVLQRDVRNVDALLGLGAIAQRQGRIADANGWYAKVLEVEPRNALATSAILDSQSPTNLANQGDAANNESRIKNMLAKQPDDANLHATLGNFYADLNQWAAAQQAYFDAFRLNASADNAFNLAVSLDQLGKPKLALPYYQRALQLAQSGSSNIDKNVLEARIAAIQ
ncbi:tetratricopeptide repeat protein [Methylotenera versatilis]|uniref:tetratricopeptide repeat protein n=2 Tax=Methylotenera TaxID=359407 RepID=UPI00036D3645|nr:hypothetical protein [Methylotenera versatilis]